jgi:D-glycero-alpha-D-manno-heptose-7-phosphate kinase
MGEDSLYDLANISSIVRSRAPVRIYFGGGGTDISPYTEESGGVVLSAAISKYTYGSLTPLKNPGVNLISADYKQAVAFHDIKNLEYSGDLDLMKAVIRKLQPKGGFELFLRSDVPPNTGVGSSATAALALLGLFNHIKKGRKLTSYELAELAFKIEAEELKNVGGRQDQYSASFGGINLTHSN